MFMVQLARMRVGLRTPLPQQLSLCSPLSKSLWEGEEWSSTKPDFVVS